MASRGRPPRSAEADEYIRWRRAEEKAAANAGPWGGRVDDVADAMIVDPVTVNRWRRTVPSVATFRAWLHDTYDGYDGMAEAIDRGDFDAMRATLPAAGRTQADYLADIIQVLAAGRTTADLARMLGVSPRTVRRYRTD